MPLVQIAITLIVVGVLLRLVNRFIPMAGLHQVDSECCRSHLCGGVAPKYIFGA